MNSNAIQYTILLLFCEISNSQIYIFVYIYIYVCVYMCVCIYNSQEMLLEEISNELAYISFQPILDFVSSVSSQNRIMPTLKQTGLEFYCSVLGFCRIHTLSLLLQRLTNINKGFIILKIKDTISHISFVMYSVLNCSNPSSTVRKISSHLLVTEASLIKAVMVSIDSLLCFEV